MLNNPTKRSRTFVWLFLLLFVMVSVLVGMVPLDSFSSSALAAAPANLALNKTAAASSTWSSSYPASKAVNGNTGDRWSAADSTTPAWLQVDFGATTTFNKVLLSEYQGRITSYKIQYSSNGTSWSDAKSGTKTASSSDTVTFVDLGGSFSARYIRLYISACSNTPTIYEIEVYNTTSTIHTASNATQLNSAISAAKPGDTIIMSNGTWTDVAINFSSANATSSNMITLKAQNPGAVILNGASTLTFSAPYLVADGLYFKQGALASGQVVRFNSNNCRLTNSAIVDYNPASATTSYYYVYFNGNYNRMDHCQLKGKNNAGPVVGNDGSDSKYNKVDYCYITSIPYISDVNGREIFRIWGYGGNEELGSDGAYFTIEYNLFENADGEGSEIISFKSNYNIARYNTIRATRGGITLRSGNYNTVQGNFILGGNAAGSSGIRVAGQSHTVVNNYIADVAGEGLNIMCGEYIDTYLTPSYDPILRDGTPLGRVPRYGWVKNGTFAHNTIVNAGGNGITIGSAYKSGWPASQRVLIPENNRISNNIVKKSSGNVMMAPVQDVNSPLDIFTFQPNLYEGNIVYGGTISINPVPSGITAMDPLLSLASDGLYRIAGNSPAVNNAVGSYVTEDMDGQIRSVPDAGADEYYATGSVVRKPLTASDVGTSWTIN